MSKLASERPGWGDAVRRAGAWARRWRDDEHGDWAVTHQQPMLGAPTQIMHRQEDDSDLDSEDLGRPLGTGQWEWFIGGTPADAMQQRLQQLAPPFIALHDVGTAYSRRLLGELALAAHVSVQQLVLRHRDNGLPLATLHFVELPGDTGDVPLRLYSTEVDADMLQRQQLARVLLAHSRLGVVLVGDLPAHALQSALRPLHDAIIAGPWNNPQLLMLPLAAAGPLATQAPQLALGTGVTVRSTPQVTRSADAWAYISGAWNRLREQQQTASPTLPRSLAVRAAPATPATPHAGSSQQAVAEYVRQCGQLRGMAGCCVFELYTQRCLAYAGERFDPAALAAQGASLFGAMGRSRSALGLGDAPPEAWLTLGQHLMLLRALPRHPSRVLLALLDRQAANPTLVGLQLQRLDGLLAPA